MSNKQRKTAKKRQKEKQNKHKRNVRNNTAKVEHNLISVYDVEDDSEEEIIFPIASDSMLISNKDVEEMQAVSLYLWEDKQKKLKAKTRYNLVKYCKVNKVRNTKKYREYYFENIDRIHESIDQLEFYDEEYGKNYKKACKELLDIKSSICIIAGTVVGVKYGYTDQMTGKFYKNVTSAIQLATPVIIDNDDSSSHIVDTHMWLYLNRLLFTIPKHREEIVDMSMHIGDEVTIIGMPIQYSSIGEQKIGIDWWYLLSSRFKYYIPSKLGYNIKVTPNALKRRACVCPLVYRGKDKEDTLFFDGVSKHGIRSYIEEELKRLRNKAKEMQG